MVPCCSCPIIELETGFTGGDCGHSLTTELSCGEENRAGWVMYGWLGGNKLEAGCVEPWLRHSHPTHGGLAQSGPCTWTETHTGQQIKPDKNSYCLNFWYDLRQLSVFLDKPQRSITGQKKSFSSRTGGSNREDGEKNWGEGHFQTSKIQTI